MAQDYTEINLIISAGTTANVSTAFFPELKANLQDASASGGGTVDTDATLTGDGSALDPLSVALPVPAPADPADDGKILTAGSGAVSWATAPSGLPDTSGASADDVLMLDVSLDPYWGVGVAGPQGDPGAPGATGATGGFNSVQTIDTITASRTLVIGDAGKLLKATAEATITIPTNASVEFSVGQHIDILAGTASTVDIVASMGVDLRAPYGDTLRVQWAAATLVKLATDEWLLVGDLDEGLA